MNCLEIYFTRTFSSQFADHYLALVKCLCLRTSKDLSVGVLDKHISYIQFGHTYTPFIEICQSILA
uniref:Uncharacterized protein n=1 Tax=Triticum urartu TaxID=4572 RepID=A0A8R7K0X2_TRIUA